MLRGCDSPTGQGPLAPISTGLAEEQCPLTVHGAPRAAGEALSWDRPSLPGHSQGQAPVTNPPRRAGAASCVDGSSLGHAACGRENGGDPASREGEGRMRPDTLVQHSRVTLLRTRAACGAPGELESTSVRAAALPFTSFHTGAAWTGPTRSWEHESHRGRDEKGWGGTTRPTFAFALVHHFEVGVVSALGRQQVALVSVGVAVGAADLQLAGQAGAVGGTGALGTPVLHLADLVGAAHHPLAALWGQRGAAREDAAPAAHHEGRIHPAQPGWHPGPMATQGDTDQDGASISPRGPESLPESQHARSMPSCPEQHLDLLSSAKEQVLGWSSARSSSTRPSQSPGPPLSTS